MNEREKAFMEDLRAVCRKHAVQLDDFDDYDSDDRYTGTDWWFQNYLKGEEVIYLSIHDVQKHLY